MILLIVLWFSMRIFKEIIKKIRPSSLNSLCLLGCGGLFKQFYNPIPRDRSSNLNDQKFFLSCKFKELSI